jgi:flagellar motor switch/type III secretory pathway protein FliN
MNYLHTGIRAEMHTPDWVRSLDPTARLLMRLLESYQFRLPFSCEGSQYDFYIEKAEHVKTKKVPFSIATQLGELWIQDYGLFFNALTGIPVEATEIHLIQKRIVMALAVLPIEVKTLFGWMTPNFSSVMPNDLTPLRFRLHAPDCDVITLAYATHRVWNQLVHRENLHRIEYQQVNDVLPIKRNLTLGYSHLTRGDLKVLRVGDLLRLDVCEFDSAGQGYIQLATRSFKVSWIGRGNSDVFEIINETSTMKVPSQHNDDQSTTNDFNDESNVKEASHLEEKGVNAHYLAETTHEIKPIKVNSANELPIRVDVYVGTFVMNERQISTLHPTDLIRVEPHYRNRVSLQVNNAEIGIGEIISLEGEVAIQIVRMWGNS